MSPDSATFLDLDDLVRTLRRRAVLILGTALIAGVGAVAALALLGKERAEATLSVASIEIDDKKPLPYGEGKLPRLSFSRGITPPEYKTLAPRFDAPAFADFVARRQDVEAEAQRRVARELAIDDRRREFIMPVFTSTRSDLRELGETGKQTDNLVLGVRISHGARDRDLAKRVVALASDFVAETIFLAAVSDVVKSRAREHDANRLLSQNVFVNTRFVAGQIEERGRVFERLRAANPDLGKGTPQQVVSVADSGWRYLAPSAQLVGVEATLAEFRERIQSAERQARKAAAQSEYYRHAETLLAAKPTSSALIAELRKEISSVFPEGSDPDGAIAEGRNEALLDLLHIVALREQGLQFIAEPVIAERDPSMYVKVGLGALAATMILGVALVLTAVWWRSGHAQSTR